MIEFEDEGDYSKLNSFLEKSLDRIKLSNLDKYGRKGVNALSSATPKDTGLTSESWYYEIERSDTGVTISFCNSNIHDGVPIAVILNYGHGTGTGGWVEAKNYIDPAIIPVFNEMAFYAWKEVIEG